MVFDRSRWATNLLPRLRQSPTHGVNGLPVEDDGLQPSIYVEQHAAAYSKPIFKPKHFELPVVHSSDFEVVRY